MSSTDATSASSGLTEALAAAAELDDAGEPARAVALLTAANRRAPATEIEEALVRYRHRAALAALAASPPVPAREPISPAAPSPLPEYAAADLTADLLRDGFAHHGCVLVRGLLDESAAAAWRERIDRALDAFDAGLGGAKAAETSPWYRPFRPDGDRYRIGGRKWMRESGGVWSVDSPHLLFELCDLIESIGIVDLVTDYLGERPMLSANKCNLRRVPTDTSSNWHQDGAFLGADVKSVNLWLALGHCGVDAPALDIVPRRIDRVVATGTDGAWFDWSIAPDVVEEAADGVEVVRPEFRPGDALLFDHLFVHRTGVSESMTLERHAIETWLFAPSCYPEGQIPVLL